MELGLYVCQWTKGFYVLYDATNKISNCYLIVVGKYAGVTSGAGTAYPSEASEFTPGF